MSDPTVGSRMRGCAVPYFLALTVLWVLFLLMADVLPKDGELIPRGGTWRPATDGDRIQSFLWLTLCWYFGATVVFGLVWRVGEVVYSVVFGDERK
ncbi:hypothetical protein [Limnoglobus roseus]|uniref:Uncharacterized protein n=1 Tax=Limnoglobus roseus TaxID=2598579 RepID=A0A5C1ADE6_9BACT|nr:hypothetical protein [Limnoglobus roseus]QEL15124.1 hypothetical protein PX52LOC_02033 [Limnoglobus roseus]